ncbi:hypothetical protein ZWY2020_051869 [Hordeum vulgare]|nr:hypothetical protein ZWY2020_051077 [Hordeum vulgare]KAI4992452.1 hypothetical protein ZWY2020_051869 [Hordeum vulgare]
MEGISFAIQRSDLPILIEMDSSRAVAMISSGGPDRSMYASLVGEIKYLMSLRKTCINLIPRSQNKPSDRLASFGRIQGRTMTWVSSAPEDVLKLVLDDCMDPHIE